MIPSAAIRDDWESIDRVAFRDVALGAGATEEPQAVADTLQALGGYRIVDRRELRAWLEARRTTAEGTILVNIHGRTIPPEGLREYMSAGGRLVWCGAGPDFLGFSFREKPPTLNPPRATPAGVEWGFHPHPRGGRNYVPAESAGLTLVGVDGWSSIFFLNLDPSRPQSGLLRVTGFFDIGSSGQDIKELMRSAAHGIGEPFIRRPVVLADAPAATPAGPGELVASGSFRIDREAALSKLSAYRFVSPESFLLPWARAASASGAGLLEAWAKAHGDSAVLWTSFDGAPLPDRWTQDPIGSLFAEGDDSKAAREVAFCIVAAAQASASRFELTSGGIKTTLRGFSATSVEPGREGERKTTLLIHFEGRRLGRHPAFKAIDRLNVSCRAARFKLKTFALEQPGLEAEDATSVRFDGGSVRGLLRPSNGHSRLQVHALGARVCEVAMWTWPVMVEGEIDASELTLNLSQSGIVRDAAFDRMLAALKDPMLRLVAKVLASHSEAFREAARLVRARGLEGRWRRLTPVPPLSYPAEGSGLAAWAGRLGGAFSRTQATLRAAALPVWWLRRSTYHIPEDSPLMDAPVWFAADGGTLSRRRLEAVANRLGYIPVASRWQDRAAAGDELLLLSDGDRRLAGDALYGRPLKPS
ncbi:MAG: hypothetical protein HY553_01360 [Elusimicrobia bacterium]|nr:hypothetical protein [Elusimicrobiota bacterium]